MIISTENIASNWGQAGDEYQLRFSQQDGIATESQQEEHPAWEKSIDALLELWKHPASAGEGYDAPPSRDAIEAAIDWLATLRKHFPEQPPTYIVAEPSGGIIVERRGKFADKYDCICQFTFYNNHKAERTDYIEGRVQKISPIPFRPHGVW